MKRFSLVPIFVAVAASAGMSAAVFTPGIFHSSSASAEDSAAHYKVNSNGETYGSAAGATDAESLPDLIGVQLKNGLVGYITRADFEGPNLTREEVLQLPTDSAGNYSEPARTVRVYAQDGTTVIGAFTIQAGSSLPVVSVSASASLPVISPSAGQP